MLSFQGGINVPGYTASKSARRRADARRWPTSGPSRGVNVNAVAPGYVATANTHDLRAGRRAQRRDPGPHPRRPLGASRRDIAGAVLFLCSRAADYVHGAVLPVDGGWLAR